MSVERTLHHFPLDPASRQVRLALGEKRLAFTEVHEKPWERRREFEKLNPSGLTPVLVETGGGSGKPVVVCESRAILEHLEEAAPEPDLIGRDPAERAETRRLLNWFDRKFDYEVNGLLLHEKMEKRLLGLGAPELAALRAGRDALRLHMTYLEGLLAERDWLNGRRMSLADFAGAAHLSVIDYFGDVPWRDFSGVRTWYMKLKSRPCFRPSILADRWPGLVPAPHFMTISTSDPIETRIKAAKRCETGVRCLRPDLGRGQPGRPRRIWRNSSAMWPPRRDGLDRAHRQRAPRPSQSHVARRALGRSCWGSTTGPTPIRLEALEHRGHARPSRSTPSATTITT